MDYSTLRAAPRVSPLSTRDALVCTWWLGHRCRSESTAARWYEVLSDPEWLAGFLLDALRTELPAVGLRVPPNMDLYDVIAAFRAGGNAASEGYGEWSNPFLGVAR